MFKNTLPRWALISHHLRAVCNLKLIVIWILLILSFTYIYVSRYFNGQYSSLELFQIIFGGTQFQLPINFQDVSLQLLPLILFMLFWGRHLDHELNVRCWLTIPRAKSKITWMNSLLISIILSSLIYVVLSLGIVWLTESLFVKILSNHNIFPIDAARSYFDGLNLASSLKLSVFEILFVVTTRFVLIIFMQLLLWMLTTNPKLSLLMILIVCGVVFTNPQSAFLPLGYTMIFSIYLFNYHWFQIIGINIFYTLIMYTLLLIFVVKLDWLASFGQK